MMPVSSLVRACVRRLTALRACPTRLVGAMNSGSAAMAASARRQSSAIMNAIVDRRTMTFCAMSASVPLITSPTP